MADEAVTETPAWKHEYDEWVQGREYRRNNGEWMPIPKSGTPDIINRAMGWCGCGNPENIDLLFLWELRYLSTEDRFKIDDVSWKWRYKNHTERMGTARDIVGYILDVMGATEHGGSVGGAWLTDEGVALRDALSDCYPDDDYLKGL